MCVRVRESGSGCGSEDGSRCEKGKVCGSEGEGVGVRKSVRKWEWVLRRVCRGGWVGECFLVGAGGGIEEGREKCECLCL